MSDDYHRPTLTFPSGAYNATQVRLYGIAPGGGDLVYPNHPKNLESADFAISVRSQSDDVSKNDKFLQQLSDSKVTNEQFLNLIASRRISGFPDEFGYATQISLAVRNIGFIVISTGIWRERESTPQIGTTAGSSRKSRGFNGPSRCSASRRSV